jgi:hypothetical protein
VNRQFIGVHSLEKFQQSLGVHDGVRSGMGILNVIPEPAAAMNR